MTDEQLIEEAAKAIANVRWNHALPHASRGGANWTDRDLARAALAVFEKALGEATVTPTDNDRRSAARALRDIGRDIETDDDEREAPIAEVDEAFRQHEDAPTWQDDPVGRDAALRWHMRGYKDGLAAGFRRSEASEHNAWVQGWNAAVEAQGEPSSEVPEPSADLDITLNTMLLEDNKPLYPEPQGEPSDAQVRAAAESIARDDGQRIDVVPEWADAYMPIARAALRAAGGVR